MLKFPAEAVRVYQSINNIMADEWGALTCVCTRVCDRSSFLVNVIYFIHEELCVCFLKKYRPLFFMCR
jgi:hypothetical protein